MLDAINDVNQISKQAKVFLIKMESERFKRKSGDIGIVREVVIRSFDDGATS